MLPLEHSAILLTCIKRKLVLKANFGVFLSGRLRQVLLYMPISVKYPISTQDTRQYGSRVNIGYDRAPDKRG